MPLYNTFFLLCPRRPSIYYYSYKAYIKLRRFTLALSLFSTARRGRLLDVVGVSASDDLLRDAPEVEACSTEGLWKIVGIASALSRLLFDRPKLWARAASASKQSSVKCSLHSTECSVASQRSRVRLTCFTHFSRSTGSFGNLNKEILSLGVLEQPAATQRRTIFQERRSVGQQKCISEMLLKSFRSRDDVTETTPRS